MVSRLIFDGVLMVFSIDVRWCPHGVPTVYRWCPDGVQMVSRGFPVVSRANSEVNKTYNSKHHDNDRNKSNSVGGYVDLMHTPPPDSQPPYRLHSEMVQEDAHFPDNSRAAPRGHKMPQRSSQEAPKEAPKSRRLAKLDMCSILCCCSRALLLQMASESL